MDPTWKINESKKFDNLEPQTAEKFISAAEVILSGVSFAETASSNDAIECVIADDEAIIVDDKSRAINARIRVQTSQT